MKLAPPACWSLASALAAHSAGLRLGLRFVPAFEIERHCGADDNDLHEYDCHQEQEKECLILGVHSSARKTREQGIRGISKCFAIREKWWTWPGSNRRPPACKAGALPAELHAHSEVILILRHFPIGCYLDSSLECPFRMSADNLWTLASSTPQQSAFVWCRLHGFQRQAKLHTERKSPGTRYDA